MSGILLDHIAIATERIADVPAVLVGRLGGASAYGGVSSLYRFWQWRFTGGGRIEVLEPVGADGFLRRFLAARGPGVHHVTFRVPSLNETCARARALGYEIVGYDDADPDWKEAFLHPRQALGVVVQFAETISGGADGTRWTPPAGPPDPPPAVTIIGLRLRARSPERADRQWGQVLAGECTARGGDLVYRWPGSPMRLTVEIDPTADEGPLAIEYESEGREALPPDRDPILGAVFIPQRSSG